MAISVKPMADGDEPMLRTLFVEAGQESVVGSFWGHSAAEASVYMDPYIAHARDTLLVAWDEDRAVGYLTGCVDTARFPSEAERFDHAIRTYRLMRHPPAIKVFARSLLDSLRGAVTRVPMAKEFTDPRWPAHLHINVVPEARGGGAGSALMSTWLDMLRARGVPGCVLQTQAENERAIRFFSRHGFGPHGPVRLISGMRYRGGPMHQLTMVRGL